MFRSQPITREDVIYAYRFLLYRDPESEEAIQHHLRHIKTFGELRDGFMRTPEFGRCARYPGGRFEPPAFLYERSAGVDYADGEPSLERPVWQFCTAAQFASPVYRHWTEQRRGTVDLHRKEWEWSYILAVLAQFDMLRPGRAGLGFAVGAEALPAVMASHGCRITATDAPPQIAEAGGWVATHQYAGTLERLNDKGICDPAAFAERVRFRFVDMNDPPDDLGDFDFVWSSCAFEHLGSLRQGLDFVERAMRFLRPGGVAVHTTEFNLSSNELTVVHPDAVFYRKCDIEDLHRRLTALGHRVLPINLNTGNAAADRFVDVPPYTVDPAHLKLLWHDADLSIVATSIGIIVQAGAG